MVQGEHIALRAGFASPASSSVIGRVDAVTGDVLVLEVQDQVRIQVLRGYVDGKWTAPAAA